MSEDRKAKAAARRAKRQARNTEPSYKLHDTQAEVNTGNPLSEKPKDIVDSTHYENGRVLDAAVVTADAEQISPITGKAEVMNPAGLAGPNRDFENVEEVSPIVGKAEVSNPAGLAGVERPKTFSDYLADQRKILTKDKTDAVKMQKYYALTDALGAIGKMAGTAVGGGIGGDTLGGATVVPEYKPSRGYVDAFERARQANDRLRALDDKEFQLAYNQQMRDEDRAYKAKVDALDKKWQKDMFDYKTKIQQAIEQGNMKLRAQLEAEARQTAWDYQTERDAILHENAMEIKRASERIVDKQMGGKGNVAGKDFIPVRFSNRKVVNVPVAYYNEIANSLMGRDVNGKYIDKTNVRQFIEDNPDIINDYLVDYGIIEAKEPNVVIETEAKEADSESKAKERKVNRISNEDINAYRSGGIPSKSKASNDSKKSAIDNDDWESAYERK
jgi:hypothetical protein